ncbi:MAG: Holliday junction resolvase RuvX [Candidatus Aminicenantales bacterium]
MRILGIDYGDRKIGLAVSDRLGITAQAIGSYSPAGPDKDKEYFESLVSEYGIQEVVVGLPLRMDGSFGRRAQKTKAFASWLEKTLGLRVILWDERLSTKQARRILSQERMSPQKKRKIEDQVSAVIILSAYLESTRRESDADPDR